MSLAGDFDLVVVGSGFFGATVAYRASEVGARVLVVERRGHVGGNSYSEVDSQTGVEVHRYGSHLFHTSSEEVWRFVRQFTAFNNYRHRVFARHAGRTFTMPINLMTINQFFGANLTPGEARALIEAEAAAAGIRNPRNLEEKAISLVGRRLYEAFIKGYTAKQWETDPTALPPEVITRLPVRFSFNDFYFSDLYEGLPLQGYAAIFERMLTRPGIRVVTGCDFFEAREQIAAGPRSIMVYTGPIDKYYGYRFGQLGWRTLDFEIERPDVDDFQGAGQMNYPDPDVAYTRIHEFKHYHPERRHRPGKTLIMREYSRFARRGDEPYYPIGTREDKLRYDRYRALAGAEPDVIFGGRLGTYRYLDMHQAIGGALKCFEAEILPRLRRKRLKASRESGLAAAAT